MITGELKLSAEGLELLRDIDNGSVIYTRGTFLHTRDRSKAVGCAVQQLRAMKLVRLRELPPGARRPPSRRCELTDCGKLAVHTGKVEGTR